MQRKKDMDELKSEFSLNDGDKLIAEFDTSMGTIVAELFWQDAPMTVHNFTQLAQGSKEWLDPTNNTKVKKPLYDGTIFHRVIKDFMIQGGDPLGSGIGGPGYKFKDEFSPKLRHSAKGILSMANAGPNTNGSQFFITERATPHLDNRHSVFGQVKDSTSLDIISKIASVETDARDKPTTPVVIKHIKITKA
ncbi:MAG: peptidylprolyl isomerase [Myxococcales bacterium]|nr:MAG: peptidylprolyl isomerase [Myxococcales bacterium]